MIAPKLFIEGLFDIYDNADEIFEDFLPIDVLTERRTLGSDELNDDKNVIQRFCS